MKLREVLKKRIMQKLLKESVYTDTFVDPDTKQQLTYPGKLTRVLIFWPKGNYQEFVYEDIEDMFGVRPEADFDPRNKCFIIKKVPQSWRDILKYIDEEAMGPAIYIRTDGVICTSDKPNGI